MQFIIVGLIAGVLSGLLGIGGGVVIVPALILLAKFTPQEATGTSIGALLLPVGALGAWNYWCHKCLNIRIALLIALGLAIGVYFGSRLALVMPARVLQRVFSVFLLYAAVHMWVTS